jgi:hypothetical protein
VKLERTGKAVPAAGGPAAIPLPAGALDGTAEAIATGLLAATTLGVHQVPDATGARNRPAPPVPPSPPPGTFGLTTIGGALGVAISLGQWLVGDASRYTHAFVVLDDGTVMEAKPSGARIRPLGHAHTRTGTAYSWAIPLTDEQRAAIVAEARACNGVRYGFSAYLHLALSRFGIRRPWLIRYLERNGRMICSQLVDAVYTRAGVQLFDDGRAPFDVTPGDLANLLIERYWNEHRTGEVPGTGPTAVRHRGDCSLVVGHRVRRGADRPPRLPRRGGGAEHPPLHRRESRHDVDQRHEHHQRDEQELHQRRAPVVTDQPQPAHAAASFTARPGRGTTG